MKKLFIMMLTVLTGGMAYALPVMNPSDASLLRDGLIWEGHCGDPCDPCLSWCDAFSLRVGFYGDYVFNRHMEVDNNEHSDAIEDTEIYTNAALLVANFWDRLDFFVTLGATNIFIETNAATFAATEGLGGGQRVAIQSGTDFSWSVGVRGTLWECGCTSLGAEFQYFHTRPDIKRITLNATTSIYADNLLDVKYHEWQIGVGISHRINLLVPYIAVKWSRAKMNFDDLQALGLIIYDLKNRKEWGYAVGVSLIDCEKASVTVEGRWGDEKAVHVNGQIRF